MSLVLWMGLATPVPTDWRFAGFATLTTVTSLSSQI